MNLEGRGERSSGLWLTMPGLGQCGHCGQHSAAGAASPVSPLLVEQLDVCWGNIVAVATGATPAITSQPAEVGACWVRANQDNAPLLRTAEASAAIKRGVAGLNRTFLPSLGC